MSNTTCSSTEWDAFVRLLSSDRAILEVLVRGARRRYKAGLSGGDQTPGPRAAWREAVREVVVGAFADKGVVRLLTKKMQLCKDESQGASTHSASSRKKARSASKGAASASRAATTGTVLKASSPVAVKITSGSSTGANGAQQRSLVRGCDESPTPTFTVGSNAKSAAPVPLGLERENCARMAVFEDVVSGCVEHQKTPATIRNRASGDDAKGSFSIPDTGAQINDDTGGEISDSSPLQVIGKGKDHPPSSCIGIGDGLGTRARSGTDEDFHCKPSNTSDEGATAVLSHSNGDCPQISSTRGYHRAKSTGATPGGAGATTPPSSVGFESIQSLAGGEVAAAATPSPMDVVVESHVSVDEGELGSLLSTFERQLERGAELVRRFEKVAKPSLALGNDVKTEKGKGKAESGNTDMMSTMISSSNSSGENQFAEISNIATNIDGIAVETVHSVPEPARIGATPGEVDTESDREPERTEILSTTEEALLYHSGVSKQTSRNRGESIKRSLSGLGEQNPSPDTNTTKDEDHEDYEFMFDDEEMVVGQKSVQFTDESRWSTHEVRACFEQHELGELFYTTAELDSMLEETESEEASERSNARVTQREESLDDTAAVGGNQVPKRRGSSSGAEENVSFEKISFDDEDSDYDF